MHTFCKPLNIIKLWKPSVISWKTPHKGSLPCYCESCTSDDLHSKWIKEKKKSVFLRLKGNTLWLDCPQTSDNMWFFQNWNQHLSGCRRVSSAVCQACEGFWSCGRHWPDQVPCWLSLQHDWCHFPEGPQRPPCLEGEPLVHEKRKYRKRDREIIW